ncbi:MAG: hypothetical protein KIT84_17345 [Labilithrix sp.]|nr:hypothetical protein [Labilithrix sp.]MCW5812797.1 hypothetical protein [Labilithrix sp.]
MSKRQERPQAVGTGTAPLLYWLAVVSGLAGLTMLRLDDVDKVVPIWFGSIVGVALGQLLGVLRVRMWTIIVAILAMCWFLGPGVYFTLVALFGPGTPPEIAFMALLPAFVCGYASLTERGGLLAFWFPAMLWMLVILEGEAPGSFAPRGSLPLVLGLAALFIAFLRARESRRVALWKTYGTVGLATPAPRMVLRASPARGVAQLAWTALIGGGALLLTAWIAPKLWEKDKELHRRAVIAASAPLPAPRRGDDGLPCCPDDHVAESSKIREYMPLRSSREEARKRRRDEELAMTCSYCAPPPTKEQLWYAEGPGVGIRSMDGAVYRDDDWLRAGYGHGYGGYDYSASNAYAAAVGNDGWVDHSYTGIPSGYPLPSYAPPPRVEAPPPPPPRDPIVDEAVKSAKKKPVVAKKAPTPTVTPVTTPAPPPPKPTVAATPPPPPPPVQTATPPPAPEPQASVPAPPDAPFPWGWLFPFMAGGLVLPVASRVTRRAVTLRHLARPFWRESVEQRISNHWQRMLVGLRDAGIQMRKNEQPGAFATRIGIPGMKECAEILERVRHGVRIEDEDLATMHKSADAAVAVSRSRAGLVGRVAASFRWPLV